MMSYQTHVERASRLATFSRYSLAAVAFIFTIGVVVQVFLAGMSVFDDWGYWEDHSTFGNMIGLLTWLLPPLALLGRTGRRLVGLSFGVWVLFHLQYPFAQTDTGWVGALHAVNALVMAALSPHLGRAALFLARSRNRAGPTATAPTLDPAESAGYD